MKTYVFFFFLSFFISSAFAVSIPQSSISTSLVQGPNGPEAIIDLDRVYDPEGRRYAMSFGFSKNSLVKTMRLDCNSIGHDTMTCVYFNNGLKRDSTFLLISVIDNKGICPQPQKQKFDVLSVFGRIKTEKGKDVDAEVTLINYDSSKKVEKKKSDDGSFVFDFLDQNYYGLEIRNTDHDCTNGVSTADIVKIQKHILNIERFTTAYEYLCADINGDHIIDSKDIKVIRDMILGKISRWPNFRPPWIFVPEGYKFTNNTIPWNSMPPERQIIPLDCSKKKNYIAIKLGDVNGSNMGNLWENQIQARSSCQEDLTLEEQSREYDLLIEELERPKEVLLYEIYTEQGPSLRAFKKTNSSR